MTMHTPKVHTAVRRRQIADALLALMADEGVARISTAAVARRLGLVTSALYRHFPSKDAMLDAAVDRLAGRLAEQARHARALPGGPVRKLEFLLGAHAAHMGENQAIPHLLFSEELEHGPARRRKHLHSHLQRYIGAVEKIIAAAPRRGNPAADPRTLSIMFIGLVQSAGIYWRLSGGTFDVAGYLRKAWQAFSRLLSEEKSGSKSAARKTT